MRVIGIDPGSRYAGFGVVESAGPRLIHVAHGVIRSRLSDPLEKRLQAVFEGIASAIHKYQPQAVAVEGLFHYKNARSALVLGHARGVALLSAAQRGLEVFEYPPSKVKRAVGAGGASEKDAVWRMVQTILKLEAHAVERADASDALAVAICHLNSQRPAVRGPKKAAALGAFSDRLRPALLKAKE